MQQLVVDSYSKARIEAHLGRPVGSVERDGNGKIVLKAPYREDVTYQDLKQFVKSAFKHHFDATHFLLLNP